MNRRELTVFGAAVIAGVLVSPGLRAASGAHLTYTPEAFAKVKASGRPLLVDFYAPW